MLRKVLAHLSIVFAGMCFVLFVIDKIKGGAMSFINNDITKAFIAILSLLAVAESVITLAAQTREQKLLRMVQAYRQRFGALPSMREGDGRPAQARSSGARQVYGSRAASPRPVQGRPASTRPVAQGRPASARPIAQRPAQSRPAYGAASGNGQRRSRYSDAQGRPSVRQR